VLAAPRPQPAYAPVNPQPAYAPVNSRSAYSQPGAFQAASAQPTAGSAAPFRQAQPAVSGSAPYGGSLLGMARGSMPPAPRPTPVNATYNAN
jgi:hypothetical protein